jgi:hypothetical protein
MLGEPSTPCCARGYLDRLPKRPVYFVRGQPLDPRLRLSIVHDVNAHRKRYSEGGRVFGRTEEKK